jgi:hypothetical protein
MKKKQPKNDGKILVFKKEIISDFSQAAFRVSKDKTQKLKGGNPPCSDLEQDSKI